MLPAGHDDRFPSLFDASPLDDPGDETGIASLRASRPLIFMPRLFVQGRIIGHLLPMIATTEEAHLGKASRTLLAHAYDEM
ncbi:hypothetical protein IP76_22435 [Rhizobium sp. AAP43]|nr:hypothetical protein IP76_22435 [Rhizobium sp. AAP43]